MYVTQIEDKWRKKEPAAKQLIPIPDEMMNVSVSRCLSLANI